MGRQQHEEREAKAAPAPETKPAEENTNMPQTTTSSTKTARTSRRTVIAERKGGPKKVVKHAAAKGAKATKKSTKALKPLDPNRVTLRAELNAILKGEKGKTMSVYHLAQRVSERKRFHKRDGRTDVTTQQVYTTAKNSGDFKMKGTQVTLVAAK